MTSNLQKWNNYGGLDSPNDGPDYLKSLCVHVFRIWNPIISSSIPIDGPLVKKIYNHYSKLSDKYGMQSKPAELAERVYGYANVMEKLSDTHVRLINLPRSDLFFIRPLYKFYEDNVAKAKRELEDDNKWAYEDLKEAEKDLRKELNKMEETDPVVLKLNMINDRYRYLCDMGAMEYNYQKEDRIGWWAKRKLDEIYKREMSELGYNHLKDADIDDLVRGSARNKKFPKRKRKKSQKEK